VASECSNLDGMTPHLRSLSHLAAAAALFAACAGAPANVLDPAFDFGAVLSYAWKEPPRFAAGAADEDWTPTGDERRWRVDAMVDALLERLPR
jgi:hypothetical protein